MLAVGTQAAAIVAAYLTGDALAHVIESQDRDRLWVLVVAILAVGVLRALLMAGRRLISGRQALAVEFDLRNQLYAKLLRLSFRFYDSHQTGQLMSRATVDLQSVRFFLGYGLIFFFQHVLTIVGVTAVMLAVNWQLALVAGAITPLIVALAYRYSSVVAPRAARRPAEDGRHDDGRRGEHRRRPRRQVVRAGAERAGRSSRGRSERVFTRSMDANRQRATYVPVLSFLPLVAQAAVILVGGRMVVNGQLSLTDFFFFNFLVAMLVHAAPDARDVDRPGAAGDRVGRAHLRGARRGRGRRRPPRRGRRCRRRRAASASRTSRSSTTDGRPVLEGIDLELEPGRTVALIGHTGSGKTTLAGLVPRFYDVTAGRVTVDGARRARPPR